MESGTLRELQMKKKKIKHNLCYTGLVILIILLILPVSLRLLIRDGKGKVGEKSNEKIYMSLNCSKGEESISSTFLNDEPQNLMYRVNGNKVNQNIPDESSVTTQEAKDEISNSQQKPAFTDNETVLEVLSKVSILTYDESDDTSYIKIPYNYMESIPGYSDVFGTIESQEKFFTSRGFSCTKAQF